MGVDSENTGPEPRIAIESPELPTTQPHTSEDNLRNISLNRSADVSLEEIQQELQEYIEGEDQDENVREEPIPETEETEVNEQHEVEQPPQEQEQFDDDDEDEDSDFGSFDDVSFEEPQEETSQPEPDTGDFSDAIFNDKATFEQRLEQLMHTIFPTPTTQNNTHTEDKTFLSDRSLEIFNELSALPHLKPPNWTKSKIRHNLLIKLGIPINLDEIASAKPEDKHLEVKSGPRHARTRSINADDIKWDNFDVPAIETLKISPDNKAKLLATTPDFLSKVETDNLNNSTKQFLENSNTEEILDAKLQQYQSNYTELLKLSSVWNDHLHELQSNFEIYESVVQNFIGYSQKLRREEILENLKKVKHKSKKSKRLW